MTDFMRRAVRWILRAVEWIAFFCTLNYLLNACSAVADSATYAQGFHAAGHPAAIALACELIRRAAVFMRRRLEDGPAITEADNLAR